MEIVIITAVITVVLFIVKLLFDLNETVDKFLDFGENTYFVHIEYTKYKPKKYIRSQKHAGNKINNQFAQFTIKCEPDEIVKSIRNVLEEDDGVYNNWKIIDIKKL